MTVTDEERREAARKLRELTVCDGVDAFDIAKALRLEAVSRTEYDTESVRRLADLIDPTCHIVTTAEGIIGCDRCRTVMLAVRAKPSFCPNCGARVVSGGAE